MSKLASEAYSEIAEQYDSCFIGKTALAEDKIIYGKLRAFLRNSLLLDVGSGTGALLEHLTIKPENYVGLDIAQKMCQIAKQKFPCFSFILADGAHLPFRENTFDSIVSLWGGMSYAHPHVYEEVFNVLKRSGRYFLMLFNARYKKRKTYIFNQIPMNVAFHALPQIKELLPDNSKIEGFNFHGEVWEFLPKWMIQAIIMLEQSILGRVFSRLAFISIVTGIKHEN